MEDYLPILLLALQVYASIQKRRYTALRVRYAVIFLVDRYHFSQAPSFGPGSLFFNFLILLFSWSTLRS